MLGQLEASEVDLNITLTFNPLMLGSPTGQAQ